MIAQRLQCVFKFSKLTKSIKAAWLGRTVAAGRQHENWMFVFMLNEISGNIVPDCAEPRSVLCNTQRSHLIPCSAPPCSSSSSSSSSTLSVMPRRSDLITWMFCPLGSFRGCWCQGTEAVPVVTHLTTAGSRVLKTPTASPPPFHFLIFAFSPFIVSTWFFKQLLLKTDWNTDIHSYIFTIYSLEGRYTVSFFWNESFALIWLIVKLLQ